MEHDEHESTRVDARPTADPAVLERLSAVENGQTEIVAVLYGIQQSLASLDTLVRQAAEKGNKSLEQSEVNWHCGSI